MKQKELIELLVKVHDNLNKENQFLGQLNEKLDKIEDQVSTMYRPNFKVFNDRVKPLFDEPVNIFSRGIVGPGTVPANASLAGRVYSIQTNDLSVSNNYYVAYYLENPSDSVVTAQIACAFGYVKVKLESDMYKDVTAFTGVGVTPRNNNAASSDSSALTVKIASNVAAIPFSGGTALYYCAHDASFVYDFNGVITIPPGHNCVICYQNTSGGISDDSHFNVRWWEIPI